MVWSDVVVSDGALSQAIRTLRRALGDDPREPAFIRTVSRHGYRFVHPGVIEETEQMDNADDLGPIAPAPGVILALSDPRRAAIEKLVSPDPSLTDDERREAAETLHALGTREALERLGRMPGHEAARALLRDTRWDVPGAGPVLVCCGALGGLSVGFVAHLLGRWTLEDLFGHDLSAVGGGIEGLAIGAAAGLGYALATPRPDGGMAAPRGNDRLLAALVTGVCCAAAGVALKWMGRNLGGPSLEIMARTFQGSRVSLTPLARLLGEPEVGPVTRTVLSAYEGLLFGAGLILGLTRRPR